MYSKILVPLDGSDVAECVLPHVEALTTANNPVAITFLYAVQPLEVIMAKTAFKDKIESEARAAAQDYLNHLASKQRYHETAEAKVVMGKAADAIVDYAKKSKMDLIVMATHGLSGVKRWVRGSVADKVLQESPVPVWLIRASASKKGLHKKGQKMKILVPLDGSERAEKALEDAGKLAEQFGKQSVELTLLRVCELFFPPYTYPPPTPMTWEEYLDYETKRCKVICQTYLSKVEDELKREGLTTHTEVPTGNVAEAIIGYANKNNFDLLVMATHGRSGLGRWALGSIADKVLGGANSPILLVRST
ncbi:MAG: universal stress protein [Chloroflexi bacterium]|nr:universal stress protein [Chloroflexota bacterium]MBM3172150.1 universal stress protein [Chloroflexota bacterium]MBM3174903.1 universal stress protein [Chloroflexota bacterium]